MILSRAVHRLNHLRSSLTLPSLLRDSPRHFSLGNQQPPQQQQQQQPSFNFVPRPTSSGLVYGRLFGISSNTLKTDVINLFEGCNLTLDDIKIEYDRAYNPMGMLLRFHSMSNFGAAIRELTRKSRSFRLEKVEDHQKWDFVAPYNGRYALFRGIPRNALLEDVERFLSGSNYDASSLEVFTRQVQFEPMKMAKVRFPSHVEAMNAVIRKNGAFCLNGRVVAQLIQ